MSFSLRLCEPDKLDAELTDLAYAHLGKMRKELVGIGVDKPVLSNKKRFSFRHQASIVTNPLSLEAYELEQKISFHANNHTWRILCNLMRHFNMTDTRFFYPGPMPESNPHLSEEENDELWDAYLRAGENEAYGIWEHKIVSNDGYVLTPHEITHALTIYERATNVHKRIHAYLKLHHRLGKKERLLYIERWDSLISFLQKAKTHNGCKVE